MWETIINLNFDTRASRDDIIVSRTAASPPKETKRRVYLGGIFVRMGGGGDGSRGGRGGMGAPTNVRQPPSGPRLPCSSIAYS